MPETTTVSAQTLKSVLIVTYGRSGSTLLQGLLNKIPGYRITGENNNFLFRIFDASRRLSELKAFDFAMAANDPTHAHYGAPEADYESFYDLSSQIAYRFIVPSAKANAVRCYGFKEIQYIDFPDALEGYLDFLRRIFPNCKIVFNTRNIDDVLKSAWWANENRDAAMERIQLLETHFSAYINKNPNACFHLTYEDLTGNTGRVQELFQFLDETYDPHYVDEVLSVEHSTKTQSR